jgi:putative lipoprotein
MKLFAAAFALTLAPGLAMAQPAFDAVDRASAEACIAASGLRDATAGPVTRFSDDFLMDVRTVDGIWPQAHMQGAPASMLCLYNRRTQRAEAQEFVTPVSAAPEPTASLPTASMADIRDVWWQVAEIDGRPPVGDDPLTLMFGTDGKIGGHSGCNNYSANYLLTDVTLKVYPPMIGTRMACLSPAIGEQENEFREIVERGVQVNYGPPGSLILTADDGRALRLVRQ